MNKYETIILVNIDKTEEERNKVLEKIKSYINNNGKLLETNELGKKQLAYEVKMQKEAYYYQIYFNMKPNNIAELERIYRITDEILKFITIKVDD